LALQVTVGGALAGLVGAPAAAQWGWQTPTVQPPQAQAPAAAPASPGASRGENFSAGKPAAQLFASDCTGAGCHKGPQGLSKDRGQSSLASFLREHYTNSRESAAALAAYLVGVPGGTARSDPKQQPRAAARSDDAAKPAERKPPVAATAPSGETGDIAKPEPVKPAAKPPRGRQAINAPTAAAAPPPAPEPPAPPPEPPKPQWDIFD
jgi:hypothetical protein